MTNWKEDFRDAFKSNNDLSEFLDFPLPQTRFPLFIPRPFAEKIKQHGPHSALWKQFIPHQDENNDKGLADPIGDKVHHKEGQIIHRYKNRVLLLPTSVCPINCRYCFRKNEILDKDEIFTPEEDKTIQYIKDHPEINEVILSGGDPLILSDEKLFFLLRSLAQIPHIEYVRFHTRTPIILPSRIDMSFMDLIHHYGDVFKKLIIVVHCNHKDEIDTDVIKKLKLLAQSKAILLSQSVLLKGVNDNVTSLKELFSELNEWNIRPYYLHHPDQVKGGMHFYLSPEEGLKIYQGLRQELPGWMLPQYVIDSADGQGKRPLGAMHQ